MTIVEFLQARLAEDEALGEGWSRDGIGSFGPRVLREVAAKRAILAEHAIEVVASLEHDTWAREYGVCRRCWVNMTGARIVAPCRTVLAIAAVYADHPDFDPAWALANPP